MSLVLSEDENMLVDSVKGFLARSAPITAFRALRDSGEPKRFSAPLWQEIVEMGLTAMLLSEEEGGSGFGYSGLGLVAEQMGHVLAASPLLSASIAMEVLKRDGSDAQKALIPSLVDGSLLVALAVDERKRHAPQFLETSARSEGRTYVLDGGKVFVADGGFASKFLVSARTDAGETLFLVDADAPGVTVKPLDLLDSRNYADVSFAGVKLGPDDVIGTPGGAKATIGRALDLGRLILSAEMLGVCQEAFDRTVEYLKEREQFGVKIGTFQALQHRAARLFTELDVARAVVMKALRSFDAADGMESLLASLAKATVSKLARKLLDEAVQMHGGIGVTDEFDIGLFLKRGRVVNDLYGDDRFHKERLGKLAFQL